MRILTRLADISYLDMVKSSLRKQMNDHMIKLKAELEEYIATGYDYEALVDLGNGWEPYQGCFQNLLMILENPDTTVEKSTQIGVIRYLVTLPSWLRKGTIAVDFDEADL